jgi:diaminohydroxyphosphoribosylaminopyrimidine deaminase/5-amino-6-(5-phosphoribosylamino)uracil reductase
MTSDADTRFMSLALGLGRRGLGNAWPNPAVGSVVVKDGVIVGRGWTQPGGRPHAEVEALRRAGAAARGATLYATLEPCSHHGKTPPCVDAILAAGVVRVVSALEDPNPQIAGQGHARLRARGVAVDVGLCAEEARRAHAGHIRRVRDGRPHVTLKLAVSADGKAGLAGRRPAAITGEAARARVHMMRAMNDAVVIGIGTVLADDPQLTVRLSGMEQRSPVRVVLDSKLRLPPGSRLAGSATQTLDWVFVDECARPANEAALTADGVEVLRVPGTDGRLDLLAMLRALAGRGITRVMVEAGPILSAAFVAVDLVDEAALFRSPHALGEGIEALEGMPLSALTLSPKLRLVATEQIGTDALQTFERKRCSPGSSPILAKCFPSRSAPRGCASSRSGAPTMPPRSRSGRRLRARACA